MEDRFLVAAYFASRDSARRVVALLNPSIRGYRLRAFDAIRPDTNLDRYAVAWLQPSEWLLTLWQTELQANQTQEIISRSGEAQGVTIISPYLNESSHNSSGTVSERWQAARHELLRTQARQEQQSIGTGQTTTAERGIAEAAYESSVFGISLVEHRYIIDGYIERLDGFTKGKSLSVLPSTKHKLGKVPIVYGLAEEAVSALKGELTEERLTRWIKRRAQSLELSQTEFQNLNTMISLRLLENVAIQVLEDQRRDAQIHMARFAGSRLEALPELELEHFMDHITQVLPELNEAFGLVLLELIRERPTYQTRLAGHFGLTLGSDLVRSLQQEQVSVSDRLEDFGFTIRALRLMTRLDWELMIERVSPAALTLALDPSGDYPNMDPPTRAWYRNRISDFSLITGTSEISLAQLAVEAANDGQLPEQRHIGYYLIDDGLLQFCTTIGMTLPWKERLTRRLKSKPAVTLVSVTVMFTLLVLAMIYVLVMAYAGVWTATIMVVMAAIPSSQIGMELSVFIIAQLTLPAGKTKFSPGTKRAASLPKMKFGPHLPSEHASAVVIPTLLSSKQSIINEFQRLEIRYLANPERHVSFGLLTDFLDAPSEQYPGDEMLLEEAINQVSRLVSTYPDTHFFLYHRPRSYRKHDDIWMGEERKRGKLEEFNALIAGEGDSTRLIVGKISRIKAIRYVITLDSDTELPPGTARRLIEAMAHPLNIARIEIGDTRVRRGFGIIQPRVSTNFLSARMSRLAWLLNDQVGVDPYFVNYSDLYHDLAGDAIYHGKGIYDPRVFHQVLGGRLPDGRILSHDLLEGNHVGVALAADIQLFDTFPPTHHELFMRNHRWTRGDWQVGIWSLSRVPSPLGLVRNPLSAIGRFKHADNLRRSLIPVSIVMLAVLSLAMPRAIQVVAVVVIVATFSMPLALYVIRLPLEIIRGTLPWRGFITSAAISIHTLLMAPRLAYLSFDAIIRTWYRLTISGRKLLEWRTAAEVSSVSGIRIDVPSLFLSLGMVALIVTVRPGLALTYLLGGWALAPLVQIWLDRAPRPSDDRAVTNSERAHLRGVGLQIWRFFDELMTAEHHHLPPDNLQVALKFQVASRTSPTNIGMGFLSWMAIRDLGFVTNGQLLDRTSASLETLAKLETFNGHIYNWYDTTTLLPLEPRYVSMVDSGNLMAALWAFKEGMHELPDEPLISINNAKSMIELTREFKGRDPGAAQSVMTELLELASALEVSIQLGGTKYLAPFRELCAVTVARSEELTLRAKPTTQYLSLRLQAQAGAWLSVLDEFLEWHLDLAVPQVTVRSGMSEDALDWLHQAVARVPSLNELANTLILPDLAGVSPEANAWLHEILRRRRLVQAPAVRQLARIKEVATKASQLADRTEMGFLYDRKRRAFHIGYDVDKAAFDLSYYDLLASEARLGSYTAIAAGQVPAEHWWALGRNSRRCDGVPVLLSWSGTMFEYFMPRLLMREYPGTLLGAAYRNALKLQQRYGMRLQIPWGISESGHSALDYENTYQYRAFGVPALGIQHGLDQGVVVSPYATMLSLSADVAEAISNLTQLEKLGMRGDMGYFEAIDFRRAATITGERGVGVYTYMSHHQGMSLVAIANALGGDPFQRRFHRDLRVRATEALLHERSSIPGKSRLDTTMKHVSALKPLDGISIVHGTAGIVDPIPKVHLLTNGSYQVMVSTSGSGYSRRSDLQIGRWSLDPMSDSTGTFTYLQELPSGRVWSTGFAPTHVADQSYRVTFSPEKAVFERTINEIWSHEEIFVAPDENVEIRLISMRNLANYERSVGVTTYMELGLADHAAQVSHPAFNKMFITVEELDELDGVIAMRRPRASDESPVFAAQLLINITRPSQRATVQTDRERFLGRTTTLANPQGLHAHVALPAQYALDPVAAVTQRLKLAAGEEAELAAVTIVADTRDEIIRLANRFRQRPLLRRARQTAWTARQAELQRLQVGVDDIKIFNLLAGYMIYPNHYLKTAAKGLVAGKLDDVSLPVPVINDGVVVAIGDAGDIPLVRQLGLAQQYLAVRGINIPVLVLNKLAGFQGDRLDERLADTIHALNWLGNQNVRPDIDIIRTIDLNEVALRQITRTARVVLDGADGSLWHQLTGMVPLSAGLEREILKLAKPDNIMRSIKSPEPEFATVYGGFIDQGRAYRMERTGTTPTPAPWSNVIAGPTFGTLVTETGAGFTWAGNSQGYRLTPWRNEPLQDRPGELIYVHNIERGTVWSPQILAASGSATTIHRPGASTLTGAYEGVDYELTIFVPITASVPVRIHMLKLSSSDGSTHKLRVTTAIELVLGDIAEHTQQTLSTRWDDLSQALVIGHQGVHSGSGRVAFSAHDVPVYDFTGDRSEFMGPVRGMELPGGLSSEHLSERTGGDLDAMAVIRSDVELTPAEPITFHGFLGSVEDVSQVADVLAIVRQPGSVGQLLAKAESWWADLSGAIQISTPSRQTDIMVNTWLPYQVLSGRIWGRTGYYQSSGAFGYRDQLQDGLALVYGAPAITRQLIIQAAGHQFIEGDVQHWWQPETTLGLRTRMSDDRLWLPYITARYIESTGDYAILDQKVPFLKGRTLREGELEAYYEAQVSSDIGTILEHCCRAIEVSAVFGARGLPIIGTGDWNDGFNRVGVEGKGESVWLAWFMAIALQDVAGFVARQDANSPAPDRYREMARTLLHNVEFNAWDGQWYQRAFYDDGTPLGSHASDEAKIDVLAQAWAVMAGGDHERARTATASAVKYLVDSRHKLVSVLTPAFDHGVKNPGYIKGYMPGIRENGGQYTHGSLWLPMALARQGDPETAVRLLEMMNPIAHTSSREAADRYVVEPYVMAGDVYSLKGHEGRGGWSWYTGSAGWMYRIWLQEILGLKVSGDQLLVEPNIPASWSGYELTYRFGTATYAISIKNPQRAQRGIHSRNLDGRPTDSGAITMIDDGRMHTVDILLGKPLV